MVFELVDRIDHIIYYAWVLIILGHFELLLYVFAEIVSWAVWIWSAIEGQFQ